jgi:hypothetical protein
MAIQTLTEFFMWCTIMNLTLMVFWSAIFLLAPDWVYRTQVKFVPVSREVFNVTLYGFLGLFKIFVLVFNLVPYLALSIIG